MSDKGAALVIIGKGRKPPMADEHDEPDGDEGEDMPEAESPKDEGDGDALDMHADEMYDALQSKDRMAFRNAFRKCLMAEAGGEYGED